MDCTSFLILMIRAGKDWTTTRNGRSLGTTQNGRPSDMNLSTRDSSRKPQVPPIDSMSLRRRRRCSRRPQMRQGNVISVPDEVPRVARLRRRSTRRGGFAKQSGLVREGTPDEFETLAGRLACSVSSRRIRPPTDRRHARSPDAVRAFTTSVSSPATGLSDGRRLLRRIRTGCADSVAPQSRSRRRCPPHRWRSAPKWCH
jgi:hypothetical protein